MSKLSTGICARLAKCTPEDTDIFEHGYTVQILSIKKVNSTNPTATDRFRIVVSDGDHFFQAMLATQLNSMVTDEVIGKHTIVVVDKLTCNYVQEKKLFIILALTVLENAPDKIGDPKLFDPTEQVQRGDMASAPVPPHNVAAAAGTSSSIRQSNVPAPTTRSNVSVFPIEGLSPYQNNWTIKARVTQKSEIKTWSNAKGEGKLFNVTFMDESGEIRGTAFNHVVDELYHKLEEGKVYYISKARVNLAKKKYSNIPNDYELSFERHTEVEECHETSNLPMIKYHFTPLGELDSLPKDSTCDVIAIVQTVGPLDEIISRQQNKTITKRDLTLVDQSGFSVRMTLWGKQAEQYTAEDSPVIAFKGAKVGDFNGRSLSMLSSSTMTINPDIEECFALRGWYDSSGANQPFQSQPHTGSGSGGGFRRTELRSIAEVKDTQLGQHDKVDFFSARATIMHIKPENISYPACSTPGCNKKVIEVNEVWRCEKCDKSFDTPEHRYIISVAVADWSGQAWFQGFNDVGVAIFGMPANELVQIKETSENKFNAVLQKVNCGTYNFSCRAKQDEYNGTTRTRYGITSITPINFKEEAMVLRDLLQSSS